MSETTRSGPESASAPDVELPVVDPMRYELHEEFSRGGSGRLVRAIDRRLGRPVAIKILRKLGAATEARFEREAKLTARLTHPAIVPIYDVGRWTTGEPFYAMKLVTGRTLKDVVAAATTLDDRIVLVPNVLAVADAIAYAHHEGVLHRDIKPANILIGPFGETIVIDWGIAKQLDGEPRQSDRESSDADASGTQTGSISGTPAYMAPEQARGERVDERADVYALAAVLYHVLTGVAPYDGATGSEIVARVVAGPPVPVEQREPGVPRELAAIVARGLAYDAAARYPSTNELADDLRRFLSGQLVGAHHYSRAVLAGRWAKRHRAALVIAALATAVLTTTIVTSFRRITQARRLAEAERNTAHTGRSRLLLEQGRNWIERDPTVALAWLKEYLASGGTNVADTRFLAAQAVSRGAAHHLLRNLGRARVSFDGTRVAGQRDGQFVLWDEATSSLRVLAPQRATSEATEFSRDSKQLIIIDGKQPTLWDLASANPPRTFEALADAASVVSFAPDGHTVAIGDEKGSLTLLRVGDGSRRTIPAHEGSIARLFWSADGRRLITQSSDDGRAFWWNLEASTPIGKPLPIPAMAVPSLAPAGDRIAWGTEEGAVRVAPVTADGSVGAARVVGRHKGFVTRVAFSPDGTSLASAGYDHTALLSDLRDGSTRILGTHADLVNEVQFSPNGDLVMSFSLDRRVHVYDVKHGGTFVWKSAPVRATLRRISQDSRALAEVDESGSVRIWRLPPAAEYVLTGHTAEAIVVAPLDPTHIASIGTDRSIRLWDLGTRIARIIPTPAMVGTCFGPGPEFRHVVSAGESFGIWTLDVARGSTCTLKGHSATINSVAFTSDEKFLASGGDDRSVWWWRVADCTGHSIGAHDSQILNLKIASSGSVAAIGGTPTISLWATPTDKVRRLEGHTREVFDVAFSADGKHLASGSGDKTIRIWDLSTGESRVLRGHPTAVRGVAFSDDGKWLASNGEDELVRIWNLETGESRLLPTGGRPNRLSFSADSKVLVAVVGDTAMLWSAVDGLPMGIVRGHAKNLVDAQIETKRSWLVTSSEDMTVRVWPMPAMPNPDARAWLAELSTIALNGDDTTGTPMPLDPR